MTVARAANQSGTTLISVTVTGAAGATASDTFMLTVNPVNDPPVANSESVTTQLATTVAITLTGSEMEGSALTYSIGAGPAHGTLIGAASNLTYTPSASYSSSVTVRFVPTSTSDFTASSWAWYFDGPDVRLTTDDEDVDAFARSAYR